MEHQCLTQQEAADITATRKSEACIKAIGSAEGTGRIVGTSIGASAAPSLSTIPYIGWVAGWVAMFGGDQGADIGGNMAEILIRIVKEGCGSPHIHAYFYLVCYTK